MPEHQRRNRTLLWSVLGVLGMLAVIVVLGTVDDANGDPLLDTPGAAFVQTIATAGLVAVAVLPLLRRTQKDAAEAKQDAAVARDHVANDHIDEHGKPINFRVDVDDFRNEFREVLGDFRRHTDSQFDGMRSDMRGIRRDVGRNTDGLEKTRARLDEHEEHSRKVVERLDGAIGKLHENVAALEITQPHAPKE